MEEEAFITSLPSSIKLKRRSSNDKLLNVRKDHSQLMDIVKKFGSKVSAMVDNQRIDYMVAYENHMVDVQKELYLLREKVQEIATDSTRDEKIKSLEAAQTKFKTESIMLDEENNEMRKRLRSLTVSMQAAERDRDWLLGRLRKAKKTFSALESGCDIEKLRLVTEDSQYSNSTSQESSLLLGLYNSKREDRDDNRSMNYQLRPLDKNNIINNHTNNRNNNNHNDDNNNSNNDNNYHNYNNKNHDISSKSENNKKTKLSIPSLLPKPAWKSRLATEVAVNRSNPFRIPFFKRKGNDIDRYDNERGKDGDRDRDIERERERESGEEEDSNNGRLSDRREERGSGRGSGKAGQRASQSEKVSGTQNLQTKISKLNLQNELINYKTKKYQIHEKNQNDKNMTASLVMLRSKKKGMKDIIEKCLKYCERVNSSSSQNNGFKSLSELVLTCLEFIEDSISNRIDEENNAKYYHRKSNNNDTGIDNNDTNNNYNNSNNNNNNNYNTSNNNNDNNENNNNNSNNNYNNYNDNNNNNCNQIENQEKDDMEKNRNLDDYNSYNRHRDETEQRAKLGSLLMSHPETFLAILDLLDGKFALSPPLPLAVSTFNIDSNDENKKDANNNNNDEDENEHEIENENENCSITIMNNLVNFDTSSWSNSKVKDLNDATLYNYNNNNNNNDNNNNYDKNNNNSNNIFDEKNSLKSLGSSLYRRSSAETVGTKKTETKKYLNKSLDGKHIKVIPTCIGMSCERGNNENNINNHGDDNNHDNDGVFDSEGANENDDKRPVLQRELGRGIGQGQGQGRGQGQSQRQGRGLGQGQGQRQRQGRGLGQSQGQKEGVGPGLPPSHVEHARCAHYDSFDDSVLNSVYDDGINGDSHNTSQNDCVRNDNYKDEVEEELEMNEDDDDGSGERN